MTPPKGAGVDFSGFFNLRPSDSAYRARTTALAKAQFRASGRTAVLRDEDDETSMHHI